MPDMKRTQSALGEPPISEDTPVYPYGLKINLGPEEIAKLMLDKELQVGDVLKISGMVEVTSVSAEELKNGKDEKNVSMQITDLYVEEEKDPSDSIRF